MALASRTKSVAFVTPYYAPHIGGQETAVRQLAFGLIRLGWRVEVHTSWWRGHEAPSEGTELDDFSGACVRRYRTPKRLLAFRPQLGQPAILHIHGFHRVLVALSLLAGGHHRRVLHPHGDLLTVLGEPPGISRLLRRSFDRTMAGLLLNRADRVFCLKAEDRELMIAAGADQRRCRIVRSAVPWECTILQEQPKEIDLFVSVGRLLPLKYLEHAIQALARLPRGRLAVVGPSPDAAYLQRLHQQVTRLGLEQRVLFAGAVSNAEVIRWLRRATALILCSKREGQGLVVAEAALQETWPVGTEEAVGPLIREMGAGALYSWGDIERLAAEMSAALARPDRRELAARGRMWVLENLHPDVIAATVAGEYEQLLASDGDV